jgi:hypothetical protein
VTLPKAQGRATSRDTRTQELIRATVLSPPRTVFSEIRAYMIRRADEMAEENNPWTLLRFVPPRNQISLIALGPTFDRGSTPEHFRFDSGARLSFGLTLREQDHGSRLVSFRYHYQLPNGHSPGYLRFDLNEALHPDPLAEPCCHLHPGLEDVRIPLTLHDPFEILDRIFFGIERSVQEG